MEYLVIISNIILILFMAGGIGMIFLGLPGNVLFALSVLAYSAWYEFQTLPYSVLVVVLALIILGEAIEFVAGMMGAKKEKASKRAMLGAVAGGFVGALAGSAVVPLIGSVIGLVAGGFVGSYAAEYTKANDHGKAERVALGVAKGQLIGTTTKVLLTMAAAAYLIWHLPWMMEV